MSHPGYWWLSVRAEDVQGWYQLSTSFTHPGPCLETRLIHLTLKCKSRLLTRISKAQCTPLGTELFVVPAQHQIPLPEFPGQSVACKFDANDGASFAGFAAWYWETGFHPIRYYASVSFSGDHQYRNLSKQLLRPEPKRPVPVSAFVH